MQIIHYISAGQKRKKITPDGYFVKATHSYDGWGSLAISKASLEDIGTYYAVATNEGGKAESSAQLTVTPKQGNRQSSSPNESPVLSPALSDQQLTEGDTLKLTVKPLTESELEWKRNGLPISINDERIEIINNPDGSQSLEIRYVDKFDAAKYSVIASNDYGITSSVANVTIQSKGAQKSGGSPKFLKVLEDTKAEIGSLVKLMVKVAGIPEPGVKWLHNGQPILARPGYVRFSEYPDGTHTLVLNDVQPEQAGEYTCVASNEFGSNTSSATLTASSRPALIKGLKDTKAEENETVTFEIRLEGYPEPEIKWMHNGEEIVPDGDSIRVSKLTPDGVAKLTIQNVKLNDVGDYRVVVSNVAGQVSSYGNLSVAVPKVKIPSEPPVFVVPLEDIKAIDGQAIKFEIEVRGQPEPTLKWYHNGKLVIPQRGTIRTSDSADGSAALSIHAANLNDAGEYKVVATNKNGSAESKAKLSIVLKPSIKSDLKDVELDEGTPLKLKIEFDGHPAPSVQWTHNGEVISPDDERYSLTNDDGIATLSLMDTSVVDGGEYRATITNEAGTVASNAIVSISSTDAGDQIKPAFIAGLYNRSVEVGKPIELSVRVNGLPEPTLAWLHNSQKIDDTSDGIEIIDNGNECFALRLNAASIDHAGEYRAIATNAVGTASTNAILTVLSKPQTIEPLRDLDVIEGQPIKLIAKVKSSPPAIIKWYHNGVEIIPDNRFIQQTSDKDGTQTLTISKAIIDNSGEYRVTAENTLGKAESSALVSVRTKSDIILEHGAKPAFEKGLSDEAIDVGSSVQLDVQVSGEPQPILKWLHNGNEILPDIDHIIVKSQCENGKASLQIRDATLDDAGNYRVIATNESGTAASDCVLSVVSKPIFVTPLKDQYAIEGDTLKFEVKIIGTPLPKVAWYYNGEKVTGDEQSLSVSHTDDGTYALTISDASADNIGAYSIEASNEHGTATSSAALHVSPNFDSAAEASAERPTFVKELSDLKVFAGFPAKLEVTCVGSPLPTLKWYRDGNEVFSLAGVVRIAQNPDGSAYLLLPECESRDAGTYKVIATNEHGSAESTCQLAVIEQNEPVSSTLGKQNIDTDEGILEHIQIERFYKCFALDGIFTYI